MRAGGKSLSSSPWLGSAGRRTLSWELCPAKPSNGDTVIVLGGDGSIPQTTSSLPPFSASELPTTILWEALVDFSKDGMEGALGNEHCLLKGSSIHPKAGRGR